MFTVGPKQPLLFGLFFAFFLLLLLLIQFANMQSMFIC